MIIMGEDRALKFDILNELFNISVGQAASLLSEMINRTLMLNVPSVQIIDTQGNHADMNAFLPMDVDGTLMVSSICFENKLTGKANLIFPAEKMRRFINLCINEVIVDEINDLSFSDIDFDIIREIGNIVLNCIVGGVSNYLHINLDYSLPEVKIFNKKDFAWDIKSNENYSRNMILLYITFIIDETEIDGAIMINLTLTSLQELMSKIEKIEVELNE